MLVACLVIFGVLVGLLSSMLGIGGGVLMVPFFRLFVGLSPIETTATSLLTIVFTSITGSAARIKNKTSVPKFALIIGIGGTIASPFGVWVATKSSGLLIMCLCALCIAWAAYTVLKKAVHPTPEEHALDVPEISRGKCIALFFGGMCAGFASGFVGLGGGFIVMPLLLQLTNVSMKLCTGTSLLSVLCMVFVGAVMQMINGNVVYWVSIALAAGAIPGALIGSRLVKRIPERILSIVLGILLLASAILLVVNELGLLG